MHRKNDGDSRRFHYRIGGNQRLQEIVQTLYQYSARYPQFFTAREQVENSIREHQMILDACVSHNVDLAKVLMRTHTQGSFDRVLSQFREREAKLTAEK